MESILNTIKKLLGIDESYTQFDTDIIIHINSVFDVLYQLGVGQPYSIESDAETWNDYLDDMSKLQMIKTYMYMKVRLAFDPPTGGMLEALKEQMAEYEWRINVMVDSKDTFSEEG